MPEARAMGALHHRLQVIDALVRHLGDERATIERAIEASSR